MLKDEMVEIEQFEKIQAYFKNLIRKKHKILLWQNPDNIHRIKAYVSFKRVDGKKFELVFTPKKGKFEFDGRLPIYFYSQKRTALFKNMIFFNSPYSLVIKLPDFLMLKNLRKQNREEPEGEMVEIQLKEDNFSNISQFKSKLLDRCEGGFAFRSSLNNVIRFQVGHKIEFKFETMPNPVKGEIVAINKVKNQGRSFNRISVRKLTV